MFKNLDYTLELFYGIALGIEYADKDECEMDESVLIIEIACFRLLVWLGDFENK